MSTIFFDISAALDGHLESMASVPPVAWPNSKYEPTKGTLYVKPDLVPADSVIASIGGTSGTEDHVGIYIVNIFSPANVADGKYEAYKMADLVADRFKEGQDLTYNGKTVRIEGASVAPARADGDRWQVPVRIRYYSHEAKR